MEVDGRNNHLLYAVISPFVFLVFAFTLLRRSKTARLRRKLPPAPPSLPVIGHLHYLKKPLHRTLHNLSAKYGPVMSLWFGSRFVVVVSSTEAVQECFTKNDVVLANRPRLILGKYLSYNCTTIGTASYGEIWRNLRRIAAIEVFSSTRLNKFSSIWNDEAERLLRKISRNSLNEFTKVHIQSAVTEMNFNIIVRMIAGKRYFGDEVSNEEEASRFEELMKEIMSLGGVTNLRDFLPILNWIPFPNGYVRKISKLAKRLDEFLQGFIDEHRNKKEEGRYTMIDHLLSSKEFDSDESADQTIKAFMQEILLAGIETSSVTIEWAMAHLLKNPESLKRARDEIDTQIGKERLVEEFDLTKLRYIQGIILETLRLTPPGPLLAPHFTSDDCTICGYNIPRDTIVLINAWSVQVDPNLWEDATRFKPERFETLEDETYKLLPFGIGRRACPGSVMAQRVMGLTLAKLIQCFEWERIDGREIDMSEGWGSTMPKLVPLEAMCKARYPIMNKLLQ